MKRVVKYGLPVVLLVIGGLAYMTMAEEDSSGLSSSDRTFLLEVADMRMMDWAQGSLATEKTTSRKYQIYGRRLMKDQDRLMAEIKTLAENKKLSLPVEMSIQKNDELNRMKNFSGESFERRFRRMIIKDHKRDIDFFKKTAESSVDPEIRDFAKRYLPLMEEHLELARDLNK
jgi:putative membrane protein